MPLILSEGIDNPKRYNGMMIYLGLREDRLDQENGLGGVVAACGMHSRDLDEKSKIISKIDQIL